AAGVGTVRRRGACALSRRLARRDLTVGFVGGDLGQLVPVRAPASLEGEGVHAEHHDAPAEVIVSDVDLVGGLVETDLLDAADDHRRGRWILLAECRARGGLRGRIGVSAAAASASCCSGTWGQEAGDWPSSAEAWSAFRNLRGSELAAVLEFRRVRDFANKLARLGVVLADGVLSEVREPLAVDVHAVTLRRVERPDHAAVLAD